MSAVTLRARMGATAAAVLSAGVLLAAVPTAATAAVTTPSSRSTASHTSSHAAARHRARAQHTRLVHRVLREAARQKGKPYSYGAAGPRAFDCSGLVRYVFLHSVHRSLPHNAAQQYHSVHHITRHRLLPGDLVFVDDGGYISHVGIFAGHHRWWVAPHSGTRVQLQHIYHAHFLYGRVLRIHT